MPPQLRARNANTTSTVAAPVAEDSGADGTSDDEWETDTDMADDEIVSQTSDVEMAGDMSGSSDEDMSGDEGTGDTGSGEGGSDSEVSNPIASDDEQLEESDDETEESDADTDYDVMRSPNENAQWPEPKSLVPAIAKFNTATSVNYAGKPDAILALHKRTMDRANIPARVRFRTESKLVFKYPRKAYLRTRWQDKYYMVRLSISGASLCNRRKQKAYSKEDVRVMLQRVADASVAVLEAAMDFETNWDWGDFADPLSPDFQFQHKGRIAQIELKSPATLSDEDIEDLFHEIPNCLMKNVPITPGGKAIPSIVSLTELPKSRDDRKQHMLIFEQVLAQMYHHNAHIGALTNFNKWIVFERGEQDMITVYKLDAAPPSRDKPRSQALDILLELAMRTLGPDMIRELLRD